jgi:NhaP-type Na+/H+ and K+/H+ antiporter
MISERSVQQKIALGIGLGLLAGGTLWLFSLLFMAGHINSERSIVFDLKFGPFSLTTLSRKEVSGGGVMAAISLHSGLLWFLLCCAGAGGTLSVFTGGKLAGRRQSDHQSERADRR